MLYQGRDDNDRSPFKEVLKSTNCVRFSPCGQYLASRDFGTVKIFDKRMEDKAVSVFAVHDWLFPWPQRKELYKAVSMFDRFDVNWERRRKAHRHRQLWIHVPCLQCRDNDRTDDRDVQ